MKKKIFALLAAAALLCFLAACTEAPSSENPVQGSLETSEATDSAPASSEADASPEASDESDLSAPEEPAVPGYDASVSHKIIVTDTRAGSVAVLDLNKCTDPSFADLSDKKCVVWEWKEGNSSLAGIKVRESEFYDGLLMLLAYSDGKAQIVDFTSKKVLWEVNGIYNAHSIEILPDGAVVVAASGNSNIGYEDGGLHYFPAGSTEESSFLSLPFAHAALWNGETLWSVGFEGIVAVTVDGGQLGKDEKKSISVETIHAASPAHAALDEGNAGRFTGHDMAPSSEEGIYWISDNKGLWEFDSKAGTVVSLMGSTYFEKGIKGIACFSDGTVLLSAAGKGNPSSSVFTNVLRLFVDQASEDGTVETETYEVKFSNREFYKIHAFCENYQ